MMYFTSFTRFKSQNPKQNHEIILNFEHFFSEKENKVYFKRY